VLIPVESIDGDVRLAGYAVHPSQTRSHPKMQYVLLNGRAIRDRALQHALSEAYRGLILTGRYPIAFLRVEMPPEAVDVNVHPTKLEVRFADSGRLYSQLLGTIRTKFLTIDLNTKGIVGRAHSVAEGPSDHRGQSYVPNSAIDERQAVRQRQELVAWAKGELAGQGIGTRNQESGFGNQEFGSGRKPLELVRLDQPLPTKAVRTSASGDVSRDSTHQQIEAGLNGNMPENSTKATPNATIESRTEYSGSGSVVPAMQVHNRYLIAESDEGVVVIDQHALHERILYEQLRERVLAGALETQRLLVPETVDLSPSEAAAALANQELLAKLGVEVAPFGGDTILVTSYPAMLANFRPAEVLHDLVASLMAEGKQPDRRDMVDELLHMIACKAAIKAGDRLSAEEVAALVEMRHLAQDSHHCPHGRPTALVFTREELDRQFLRT
jgi:DNA mismatch repair protein MutL